MRVIF